MNFTEKLNDYARLLVRVGVGLEKGQLLVIRSPIEGRDLAVACAKCAYELGAPSVHVIWSDDDLVLLRYTHAPDEVLNTVPEYERDMFRYYLDKGAAFLSFTGSDPELLKQIDGKRLQEATKHRMQAMAFYSEAMMADRNPWTVAGVPTRAWAKKVFPDAENAAAVSQLWEAIFETARVNGDAIENWKTHMETVNQKARALTALELKTLRYRSSNGTDFEIGLPEGHLWAGGGSKTPAGKPFVANIPTEEVFTLPHKDTANGVVYASMPLQYNGNTIDKFWLRFEDGKVVDFDAEIGKDVLKHLLETDEGAARLGEVALVPYDSPISNRNHLFFNTLYDENASCHLALGRAYPTCLKGGEELSKEALAERGANDSLVHVDFMVGAEDMDIDGIDRAGTVLPIFKKGNWAAEFEEIANKTI
ncbi:Aminopeptidase 2 [Aedoeadaptatus ivorii]|uniref:Aminopeptidase 2 n=1 Tax=Aedoeadaptatus ivorii TaxID=54006 RepID=A0A448V1L4_9FIRM|nr:aminopeptidase [Peptoniphilus ivorii]VEJ35620.1 Aminopeptidase 2 [Peptoniphilus ivorii]